MDIENKTLEILDLVREKVLSPDEALPHILRLFGVSGQSELLLAFSSKLMYDMGLDFDNQDEYIEKFLASNSH